MNLSSRKTRFAEFPIRLMVFNLLLRIIFTFSIVFLRI